MAFDPDHPTFYGACLQVDNARLVAGVEEHDATRPMADVIRYQFNDTDWAGFQPGARAVIGFYPERGLLTLDDEVEFFAVVELRDDSTGSIRLSAGVDPSWNLTDPSLATEPLGTHSAVGAFTAGGRSRVVVPVSSYTGAMIYAGEVQPILLFEALDGLPKIMQVRVRMWPTSGVGGAWEDDPDYTIEDLTPRFIVSQGSADMASAEVAPRQELGSSGPERHQPGPGTWGGIDDMGDTADAFSQMIAHLHTYGIPRYQAFISGGTALDGTVNGSFTFNWTQHAIGTPSHDWTGRYTSGMVIIAADPVTAFSRNAGLAYDDPDRVPGEAASGVRDGLSGGTLLSKFSGWTAYPELSDAGSANDRQVGVRTVILGGEPAWTETESTVDSNGAAVRYYLTKYGLDGANSGPPAPTATHVFLPDAPVVAVEVNGTTAGAMSSYEFGSMIGDAVAGGNRGVDYTPTRALQRYENVQFFNPAAMKKARKPRFYVTYTEVDDDPRDVSHVVGIGKPADDLSIFRVPTPLGTLRELRPGEKVSDVSVAYPLKVKLEDGSWTVVAGMTPDA
ncbi:hypothetical protein [Terrabacter sp. C0L_2]|uniref:hypothetical protein n=1 Tax=Terrabacter sp. C0L_2 TaxID=3108389 RepID=UPI002ED253C2|nr:hypothetical protein U5C87_17860 [Terrabacter sp. C0L_2]